MEKMPRKGASSKGPSRKKLKLLERGLAAHQKNPFQQHKEFLEQKKKKEEAEAAKAYEEFAASFQVDESVAQPFVKAGGEKLVNASAVSKRPQASPPPSGGILRVSKASKSRNIDSFLVELKKDAERDRRDPRRKRAAAEDPAHRGSHDVGDAMTTNLYVGNLAPSVTERMLLLEFGRFGPVGSVKIMWPRTDEEASRRRNCGFVSFMERPHAAAALRELQGFDIEGLPLRLGWGKTVALPAQALPMPVLEHTDIAQRAPELTFSVAKDSDKVIVIAPDDQQLKRTINITAKYTAKYGSVFENALQRESVGGSEFGFLLEGASASSGASEAHKYYRWRVYSLSQGDALQQWRTAPFQMVEGGPFWVPPVLMKDDMKKSSGDREAARITSKFGKLCVTLSLERDCIMNSMGFALDHAEHASLVARLIEEAMTSSEQQQQEAGAAGAAGAGAAGAAAASAGSGRWMRRQVALLHLVSDILHNSSAATVKNAWSYRDEFQSRLPSMFGSLHTSYANIEGRFTAEAVKEKILRVLRVWHSWSLYPNEFLTELEDIFCGNTSKLSKKNAPAEPGLDSDDSDIDGMPLILPDEMHDAFAVEDDDDVDDEDEDDDDMDEDIDGVPLA